MTPQACKQNETKQSSGCHPKSSCHSQKGRPDFLLWGSLSLVVILYVHYGAFRESTQFAEWYYTLSSSTYELMNTMWWGMAIGIVFVAILSKIPREFVMSILGHRRGFNGIMRATAAGLLLDLCSHGILWSAPNFMNAVPALDR